MANFQSSEIKDTQVRQHPFRAAVPMHPQQEMMKSITPMPIKEYMNLHVEKEISKHSAFRG